MLLRTLVHPVYCLACRAQNTLMVRGVNFLSRDKYLMARIKSQHSDTALSRHTAGSLLCYRVPAHLRRKHWSQLLTVSAYTAQLTDTLVLHSSALLNVLKED